MRSVEESIRALVEDTAISDPGETIRSRTERESDVDSLPEVSGDFTLGEEIGRGGMGTVIEATQRALDRQVAVKVLKPGATDTAARALLQEARITGALEHPNIVPVHALGRDERSRPVLVMKRVEGRSWRNHLDEDPERAHLDRHLGVLLQVINAIDFAHSRGYVHRDLKPDNVMIGEFGEVYVVDWGVALHIQPPPPSPIDVVGTPNYMAPEMLESEARNIDARTDVFLLGGLLHFILAGRAPHRGRTVLEVMIEAHRCDAPEFGASVPPALAAIARRALSRERADRHQTAAELRQALQAYLQNRTAELIADEAVKNLDELKQKIEAGADEAALYRIFGACRFGFQQAAQISPEGERARSGLFEAIERMARFELSKRRPEVAATLAAELDPPPADLAAQIEAMKLELLPSAAEIQKLRSFEREADVATGSRGRAFVLLGMAIAFVLIGILLGLIAEAFGLVFPFEIGLRITMVLGVVATLAIGRRWFARNAASLKLALILLASAVALLALRLLAMNSHLEIEMVLAIDLLLLGACGFIASIALDRRLVPASAVAALSAFAIAAFPEQAPALYVLSLLVTLGLVAILWMRSSE